MKNSTAKNNKMIKTIKIISTIFVLFLIGLKTVCPQIVKPENRNEKIFLRGAVFNSWFDMTLVRDGNELSGNYFCIKPGAENSLKLRGKIEANGRFVLTEFDGKNRQTGTFEGVLTMIVENSHISISGIWKNSPENVLQFGADGQSIEFTGDWRINTKTIIEENKRKRFHIFAPYPEIKFEHASSTRGFNLLSKELSEKPAAEFRRRMLAQNAKVLMDSHYYSEFYSTFYINFADDNLISIEFFCFESTNLKSDSINSVKSLNYDLKNKYRLTLADLFKPNAKYLEKISAYCLKELQSRPPINGQRLADGEWARGAGANAEKFENWNLTSEGLLITFGGYTIVSNQYGAIFVLVPYSELREIAKPAGALTKMMQ